MSLMLFTMGVGSRISRYIDRNLLDVFISIEFVLSTLCATCAIAAYFGQAYLGESTTVIYGYSGAIGLLIGMEIPIVARMNETYEGLKTNIASVMEKDYYGALVRRPPVRLLRAAQAWAHLHARGAWSRKLRSGRHAILALPEFDTAQRTAPHRVLDRRPGNLCDRVFCKTVNHVWRAEQVSRPNRIHCTNSISEAGS